MVTYPVAKIIRAQILRDARNPIKNQQKIFKNLIDHGKNTAFGKDHNFSSITSISDYRKQVPIRDYEAQRPYYMRALEGEADVVWPGRPAYFAKTSGTTSGPKYIPISKDSVSYHFATARNALFNYYARTGNGRWMDGKKIFLSGSPELEYNNGIPTGRLSGISNHLVPEWIKRDQLPSYETNIIENWTDKLERIVEETLGQDMRLISGIPPWVQMYFERILEVTGATNILEVFPNFSVFVYGGVNYEPYRGQIELLIGKSIDSVETYPASEGFIAFQDGPLEDGLLLNVNAGIYYEFVPLSEVKSDNPIRLSLEDVELGEQYALILSTNAGLWSYAIGDTVEFLSLNPYRLRVSGRVKHYISAFGEHVIGKEVETALQYAIAKYGGRVMEYTVAPQVIGKEGGKPYHEWIIDFAEDPVDKTKFAAALDESMRNQNIYYDDLVRDQIIRPLVLSTVKSGAFRRYMKSKGKLGGQYKVVHLSNDREIADALSQEVSSQV